MKKILSAILALSMAAALGACGAKPAETAKTPASSMPPVSQAAPASSDAAPAPTEQTELMVSAAASLTDCMGELKGLYEKECPNIRITYNFGASGALQQQIEQGAPADIFFSAGKKQMKALSEAGLMEDATVQDILENKVVLVTPKGSAKLASFEALADDAVQKIGVGEPQSVPVGQYTEEILQSLGLTEKLAPKLVLAKDVREVLSWVETGNVDAGVVYETDAGISDKVEISCVAPDASHKPVIYPIGVTKDSKAAAEAKKFVEFLTKSELARTTFAKYGFTSVKAEAQK